MRLPEHAGMTGMAEMAAAPAWVTVTGWVVTVIGILVALVMLADIYLGRYRQPIPAMEAVWPITAIYAGPVALWAYCRWGRPAEPRGRQPRPGGSDLGLSARAVVQTLPGAAASFLAHGIAVPIVMGTGMTIAGRAVWPMILLIAAFALPMLIAFEYAARSGESLPSGTRVWRAVRFSVPTILAFDAGMGAIMLVVAFVLHYGHASMAFWLLMWVGMWLGFLTAYPVVRRMLAAEPGA